MTTPLSPLPAIAVLLSVGAAAQWLAWRLRTPAILLLLLAGFALGPFLGLLDPDRAFGEAFRPLVSLSVGLILFEGGLTLRFDELRGTGKVVRNLVSVGAMTSWALATIAAVWVAGVDFDVALLVGAILVLTGPTVVIPIVRHVRPRPPLGAVLRWEGILIDPIGALLAVLVLEALTSPEAASGLEITLSLLRTVAFGGGLGVVCALLLGRAIERFHVPDMLHVPVTLGMVAATFTSANVLQAEAGLVAVTVMGIVLANRRTLDVAHIAEWKEQLATVLLSVLFVSIAARLSLAQLTEMGWAAVAFTGVLIVFVRPLAVLVSTAFTGLGWRDRAFLMAMAPRDIVVAAVASEFSLHLEQHGFAGSSAIVGLVFPVIVLSVVVYGLGAAPLAGLLGVSQANPQGMLIVGADLVGRELAHAVAEQGFDVLLVDTNARNAGTARTMGLRTWHGSVLSSRFADEAELGSIGNVLAITPSEEVNRLALQQFLDTFGRAGLFRIAMAAKASGERDAAAPGRVLFGEAATIDWLRAQLAAGARIKGTRLTDVFGRDEYFAHNPGALPLFVVTADEQLQVVTADAPPALRAGATVVSLVPARTESEAPVAAGDREARSGD